MREQLFNRDWNSLGWAQGDAEFYEIFYQPFGGISDAVPADCANAIRVAGADHRVKYSSDDVIWRLVTVAGNQALEGPLLSGKTVVKKGSCTEHSFWLELRKSDANMRYFGLGKTLIIYTTLTPCLKCCNSLIGISRSENMNVIVRCQADYDFIGTDKVDFWVVIPRAESLTSRASPSPRDRAVFVLHDGSMEFRGRKPKSTFKGSIRKYKFYTNPHRTEQGERCDDINVDRKNGVCQTCHKKVEVHREGSGTPWAELYDHKFLQNVTSS